MAREAVLNPGHRWRAVSAPPGWLTPLSSLIADGHSRGRLRLEPRSCLLRPAVCLPTRRRGRPHPDARATEPHRGSRERTVGGLVPPSAASPCVCVSVFRLLTVPPPVYIHPPFALLPVRLDYLGLVVRKYRIARTRRAGSQRARTKSTHRHAHATARTKKQTPRAATKTSVSTRRPRSPVQMTVAAHGRTPLPARLLSTLVQKRKADRAPPHTLAKTKPKRQSK